MILEAKSDYNKKAITYLYSVEALYDDKNVKQHYRFNYAHVVALFTYPGACWTTLPNPSANVASGLY
jgi:hypothetical protein